MKWDPGTEVTVTHAPGDPPAGLPQPPTVEDLDIVERQLGRPPRGMLAVEARCAWGYPVSVSVRPLLPETGEPFPTLFWLTCPALVEEVSRVESAGGVRLLGERILKDPALARALQEDAARHARERMARLDDSGDPAAAPPAVLEVLEHSGIGGTRRPGSLKCLHSHYAFHRARGGLVGRLVDEDHAPRECPAHDIRCGPPPESAQV